uniref:Uncharacterized protein n=1 Tax=Arundo donax TaxID=35708 RepID=A0A0A9BHE1_ARUDO
MIEHKNVDMYVILHSIIKWSFVDPFPILLNYIKTRKIGLNV